MKKQIEDITTDEIILLASVLYRNTYGSLPTFVSWEYLYEDGGFGCICRTDAGERIGLTFQDNTFEFSFDSIKLITNQLLCFQFLQAHGYELKTWYTLETPPKPDVRHRIYKAETTDGDFIYYHKVEDALEYLRIEITENVSDEDIDDEYELRLQVALMSQAEIDAIPEYQ